MYQGLKFRQLMALFPWLGDQWHLCESAPLSLPETAASLRIILGSKALSECERRATVPTFLLWMESFNSLKDLHRMTEDDRLQLLLLVKQVRQLFDQQDGECESNEEADHSTRAPWQVHKDKFIEAATTLSFQVFTKESQDNIDWLLQMQADPLDSIDALLSKISNFPPLARRGQADVFSAERQWWCLWENVLQVAEREFIVDSEVSTRDLDNLLQDFTAAFSSSLKQTPHISAWLAVFLCRGCAFLHFCGHSQAAEILQHLTTINIDHFEADEARDWLLYEAKRVILGHSPCDRFPLVNTMAAHDYYPGLSSRIMVLPMSAASGPGWIKGSCGIPPQMPPQLQREWQWKAAENVDFWSLESSS
jgi:hypothetical protein